MLRRLFFLCWICLLASTVWAQGGATSLPIVYGQTVNGTITDQTFFAHWNLTASAHDLAYVRMTGSGGLRPLIGILSAGGTLLTHSVNGDPNGSVDLNFDVPAGGTYIIVATRVDNQFGTTTGSYTLEVDNLNPTPTSVVNYQDVTFQCGAFDATAAASFHFSRDTTDNGAYSLRVYGLDGFQPVIRVQSGTSDTCVTTPADALGDVVTLPGERPLTIAQADLSYTAQEVLTSQNLPDPNSVTVTIGSANGAGGRYLAAFGGFAIEPSTNIDVVNVRLAPIPAQAKLPLLFYMVGVNNRLDPTVITEQGTCDDAGRRGCTDVPSFNNAGVIFNNGVHVIGTRFDAGAQISDAQPHQIQLLSFSGTTDGEYAVFLIGSLPASGTPTPEAPR